MRFASTWRGARGFAPTLLHCDARVVTARAPTHPPLASYAVRQSFVFCTLTAISLTSGQSSTATSGVDFRFRNVHLGRDDVRRILSKVR